MRTIEKTIYNYSELSEKSKEHARQKYAWDDFYNESITENMEQTLMDHGYADVKVNWSLSSCQGDGVSFTCEYYGRDNELRAILNRIYGSNIPKNTNRILPFIQVSYSRFNSHYVHEKTVRVSIEIVENYTGNIDHVEKTIEELERILEIDRLNLCSILEKQGYSEIEYYNSEECFQENCEANECEFYENGEMYKG